MAFSRQEYQSGLPFSSVLNSKTGWYSLPLLGMFFPFPPTHPNSIQRIMQYPGTECILMVISSKVSLRSLFLIRPFPTVPDMPSSLYHWPVKTDTTPICASAGALVGQSDVVSVLWTLSVTLLSLNFYRICLKTNHLG